MNYTRCRIEVEQSDEEYYDMLLEEKINNDKQYKEYCKNYEDEYFKHYEAEYYDRLLDEDEMNKSMEENNE